MSCCARHNRRQRGAALIIVLLLTATLSFVVLGLAELMTASVRRTASAAARTDLLWRSVSLETLARAAIRDLQEASENGGPRLSLDHPLFSRSIDIPWEDGAGVMRLADATRCFNINSLVQGEGEEGRRNPETAEELVEIIKAVGLGNSEAEKIVHVVVDWIDTDDIQEIGGAEDGFYTSLPTPFRTGGALIASVSELRAMEGVTAELYAALRPYLCALPSRDPTQVNINMLRQQDAPLLVGLTSGAVSVAEARDIIADRPLGGWETIEAFWSHRSLEDAEVGEAVRQARTSLTSRYFEVLGAASVNGVDMEVQLIFLSETDGGAVRLISRQFGGDR